MNLKAHTSLLFWLIGLLALVTTSCTPPAQADTGDATAMGKTTAETALAAEVTVAKVRHGSFDAELVSNGRLEAAERALVPFALNEMVTAVFVKEGDRVAKGDTLGLLDDIAALRRYENAQDAYDKALMDLDDRLVSMGHSLADTLNVPANMLRMARLRSGYNAASTALAEARRHLSHTVVKAPISGVVCDVEARAHNPSSAFKSFCAVAGNRTMQVAFLLLETETGHLGRGQSVAVIPYALPGKSFGGTVVSVNPSVDAKGMVRVTAELPNPGGEVVDGMNARVLVKKSVPNCLIVPKSAVLYRQDRKVVFVHENGTAQWVYVETGMENSTEVIIAGGLKAGQEAIVGNNTNLAHGSPVKVGGEQ
jgi:RND family efflux transporter MFP subunit